jgi:hypothetical protein
MTPACLDIMSKALGCETMVHDARRSHESPAVAATCAEFLTDSHYHRTIARGNVAAIAVPDYTQITMTVYTVQTSETPPPQSSLVGTSA